jgi:hypothetical protein
VNTPEAEKQTVDHDDDIDIKINDEGNDECIKTQKFEPDMPLHRLSTI